MRQLTLTLYHYDELSKEAQAKACAQIASDEERIEDAEAQIQDDFYESAKAFADAYGLDLCDNWTFDPTFTLDWDIEPEASMGIKRCWAFFNGQRADALKYPATMLDTDNCRYSGVYADAVITEALVAGLKNPASTMRTILDDIHNALYKAVEEEQAYVGTDKWADEELHNRDGQEFFVDGTLFVDPTPEGA